MSKSVMRFSLKEMYILKHSVRECVKEKQERLLKSTDREEIKDLTQDIIDENRLYDKIIKNIIAYKKENNIA